MHQVSKQSGGAEKRSLMEALYSLGEIFLCWIRESGKVCLKMLKKLCSCTLLHQQRVRHLDVGPVFPSLAALARPWKAPPSGCRLCWLNRRLWDLVLEQRLSHISWCNRIPGKKQLKKGKACFGSWFWKTHTCICSSARFPFLPCCSQSGGPACGWCSPTLREVLNEASLEIALRTLRSCCPTWLLVQLSC